VTAIRSSCLLVLLSACAAEPPVGELVAEGRHRGHAVDELVETDGGWVRGFRDAGMYRYFGIPFAAPPVGSLRWRAPQPAAPWTGVRDATVYPPICAQLWGDEPNGQEDCLFLNVFVPAGTRARDGLAVMVHLHPGGNSVGQAYQFPQSLVDRGVIVVTLNYRLSVFGFLPHPALTARDGSSGNYGLLDQIAALRWVNANIRAFGGDPDRVTLFGMSAGSFDTAALAASPLTDGLIAQAAIQGTVPHADRLEWVEPIGEELAANVGCGQAADAIACLEAVPADDLLLGRPEWFNDVTPLRDGHVLPDFPHRLIGAKRMPLLLGHDREESSVWWLGELDPETFTAEDYDALMRSEDYGWGDFVDRVLALYPVSEYDAPFWAFIAQDTDWSYNCGTRRYALASRAPVFRYVYTHVFHNPAPDGFDLASLRAAHGMEDSFLWDDFAYWGYQPTARERRLSRAMSDYWTNFARRGDPNGRGLVEWPRFRAGAERTLFLDTHITVERRWRVEHCELMEEAYDFFLE
jgi:para-nitrobenzyl esterase